MGVAHQQAAPSARERRALDKVAEQPGATASWYVQLHDQRLSHTIHTIHTIHTTETAQYRSNTLRVMTWGPCAPHAQAWYWVIHPHTAAHAIAACPLMRGH